MQRFCIGLAVVAMAVSARGAVLMATGFNDQLYVVNQATGAATGGVTVSGGLSIAGMAQGADGTIYLDSDGGGADAGLYTLNAGTHVSTLVGSFGQAFMYEGDLAISPVTGEMVAAYAYVPGAGIRLMSVNEGTGMGTVLPTATGTAAGDINSVAFAGDGSLYVIDSGGVGNSVLEKVNPVTGGVLSTVALSADLGGTGGMAFEPGTGVLYVAAYLDGSSVSELYTANLGTGELSLVGGMLPGGEEVGSLAFVNVPEPVGVGLMGMMVVGGMRRRR